MTELIEISQEISKKFVPVRDAAKRVSYTTDYVARLAREGKIEAKREGRSWLVELDSLKLFSLQAKAEAIRKQEGLKLQRRMERAVVKLAVTPPEEKAQHQSYRHVAILETTALTVCFALALLLVQVSVGSGLALKDWQHGIQAASSETQTALALDSFLEIKWPDWLWLFRYETQEVLLSDTQFSEAASRPNNVSPNAQYAPQIDMSADELLIVYPENTVAENSKYIEDNFSDSVLVEFVDSRNGTVTAEFISGEAETYPFRLVKSPINPTTD